MPKLKLCRATKQRQKGNTGVKTHRDSHNDKQPMPKDEKDTLYQGFLPKSMDGLKMAQNLCMHMHHSRKRSKTFTKFSQGSRPNY